jgi:uncharacterized membrane protein
MADLSKTSSMKSADSGQSIKVICACTIRCPVEKLYAFWRQFENLPLVMLHLVSVRQVSPTVSHWVAKGRARKKIDWEADIIQETPNKMISWRTKDGFSPAHTFSVYFEPAMVTQGTEITVSLEYDAPSDHTDPLVTELFGKEPGAQIADNLRRLKTLIETGHISSDRDSAITKLPVDRASAA